jgi:hypothetical protein
VKKIVLVAFSGGSSCFVHVLLNALEMKERGWEVRVVIEGQATGQVKEMGSPDHGMHALYERTKSNGLIDAVCKACAHQMGALEAAEEQGLPISAEMSGHVSIGRYIEDGFEPILF